MLAQAPVHASVQYRRASAYDSELQPGSADLVTVAQALHWFEPERFYVEVSRVLKPGGILAVWTYGNQVLEDRAVNAVLSRVDQQVVGPYWPPERCHVEAGYSTISFPYPELDHPDFQMQQHWTLDEAAGLYRDLVRNTAVPGGKRIGPHTRACQGAAAPLGRQRELPAGPLAPDPARRAAPRIDRKPGLPCRLSGW